LDCTYRSQFRRGDGKKKMAYISAGKVGKTKLSFELDRIGGFSGNKRKGKRTGWVVIRGERAKGALIKVGGYRVWPGTHYHCKAGRQIGGKDPFSCPAEERKALSRGVGKAWDELLREKRKGGRDTSIKIKGRKFWGRL